MLLQNPDVMKTRIVLFLLLISVLSSCGISGRAARGTDASSAGSEATAEMSEHVWDFRDATTWLLGDVRPEWLLNDPHGVWYSKGYSDYIPDEQAMEQLLATAPDSITITVVLGTWCPDSRREVPRFMKITDMWGFPAGKMRLIGVDIDKKAPLDEYPALGIERVPTFIFYKNNIELGRIIETPVTSLEQDMVKILTQKTK